MPGTLSTVHMKTLIIILIAIIFMPWSAAPVSGNISVLNPIENCANLDSIQKESQNVRVVFWNVENLYDIYDDSTRQDEEFTSSGMKHWNYSRFILKINHLAKTLLSIGCWEPPAIVGMCEVENLNVLKKLVYQSPLKSFKYRIVHYDSPDLRGVDVALLYRPDQFEFISSRKISIRFPFDTLVKTRDILMVVGKVPRHDTLILFVNHWPSRRGGAMASQPRRNHVAGMLYHLTDSILTHNPMSNILIMGDFNDEPDCESIISHLHARNDTSGLNNHDLINLMYPKMKKEGTHKFQGNWAILDQFIVSASLFMGRNSLKTDYQSVQIYKGRYLLKEDTKFFGDTPARTYTGPRHTGGFSDHLPIFLDLRQLVTNRDLRPNSGDLCPTETTLP